MTSILRESCYLKTHKSSFCVWQILCETIRTNVGSTIYYCNQNDFFILKFNSSIFLLLGSTINSWLLYIVGKWQFHKVSQYISDSWNVEKSQD